ncbi:MAG: MBOAT family protein [Candidatus Chryseobacterium colombiense]|nr:MBOAT family O-acyltransferase [Chryseobacterium sp.]WEK69548.1 MAG: MBOAT family protein [Chryseobacterium sp.]
MLFNSIEFLIFLPIVFVIYWSLVNKNLKFQNGLLFIASYVFYACWDWRFLFLLMFSTLLDYFTGLKMQDAGNLKIKKIWFWLSIVINLGFLGVFKYYNFFATSFAELFEYLGWKSSPILIHVILPLGISFYTFHGLSYVIDVYNNKIKAEKNFIDYALFVSFFPLLVAGPIERATHLLPQIKEKRFFNYDKAVDGMRQVLWGLFKKIVIADNCAEFANQIFNNSADMNGSALVLGAIFFTFQIYGDFSGYSDIAIGTARLFGIDLLRNFAFPYFSRDFAEFWRRWHISLSSWFKDYLYIPLGGSKGGKWMRIRNTFIIFIVSGFWHGANWTFVVWGLLNAIFIMPSIIMRTNRNNMEVVSKGRLLPTLSEFLQIIITFGLTVFAWIFFRAENITHAYHYISGIFSESLLELPEFEHKKKAIIVIVLIIIFMMIEWKGREDKYAIETLGLHWRKPLRYAIYYAIIIAIFWFGGNVQQFIYFQF